MVRTTTAVLATLCLGALGWVGGEAADLLPVALLLGLGSLIGLLTRIARDRRHGIRQQGPRIGRGTRSVGVAVVVLLLIWGVAVLKMGVSVGEDRRYWAQPRGEAGGLLYVALGDSAAQGIGADAPDRGYVSLLAEKLRAATGRPVRVLNLSRSGARIDDLIGSQLPRLQGLHPDLVTVAIGGNDVRAYDAITFARRVDNLTTALPAGTVIADVPYFMHGHWESDAIQAATVVRRSAEQRGLTVVGLHAALQRQGWSAMLTQTAADWFHPNDRGYRVWAQAFWAAVSASGTCQSTPKAVVNECPALARVGVATPAPISGSLARR